MTIDERLWKITQKHLRYTDEEMASFRNDPRNEELLKKGTALRDKFIILEVVEAHGCNSRHKKGDRILL